MFKIIIETVFEVFLFSFIVWPASSRVLFLDTILKKFFTNFVAAIMLETTLDLILINKLISIMFYL